MLRRLLDLLTALSLLLCVGSCAVWVRSHRVADMLTLFLPGHVQFRLYSDAGTVEFLYYDNNAQPPPYPDVERWQGEWTTYPPRRWLRPRSFWQRMGFERHVSPHASIKSVSLTVPWWLVVSAAALPAVWRAASSFRRHRRARACICPSCGYDLRATPGRCPECGTAPEVRP